MEFSYIQISLSLREKHDKIVFTLQGYFGRSDNLLRSPRIFVILDKRSELSGFIFIQATSEIGRNINYFRANSKQRTCFSRREA